MPFELDYWRAEAARAAIFAAGRRHQLLRVRVLRRRVGLGWQQLQLERQQQLGNNQCHP